MEELKKRVVLIHVAYYIQNVIAAAITYFPSLLLSTV